MHSDTRHSDTRHPDTRDPAARPTPCLEKQTSRNSARTPRFAVHGCCAALTGLSLMLGGCTLGSADVSADGWNDTGLTSRGVSSGPYPGEVQPVLAPRPSTDDPSLEQTPQPAAQTTAPNPFVVAGHDPFSTFAADVDTASYDIFVRDVENYGQLPQPAHVRVEEWVNFFDYDYPTLPADSETPFGISLAAAPHVLGNDTTLLRVGIQGRDNSAQAKRASNIVFLVDISGSMASNAKLPLVQRVLRQTVELLDLEDRVSIVTYANGTHVALPSTPISESDSILGVIDSFTAGGRTAGGAGIDLAYTQAEAGFIEGGVNHVVICTDGDFNIGPYRDSELVALIEDKRRSGVTLTALGFGRGDLNDSMMEKVSNAGNGFYGVVGSEAQADTYVSTRLLATLDLIAKDMKIQVEFNPEMVHAYRLLGYENRAIADHLFRDDTVDAGEIGAGHRVTALYELVLTGDSIPRAESAPEATDGEPVEGEREISAGDMVEVRVRYKAIDASDADPAFEVKQTLRPGAIVEATTEADQDLQWAAAVAATAEVLRHSPYVTSEVLDTVQTLVNAQADRDAERAQFAQLLDDARGML